MGLKIEVKVKTGDVNGAGTDAWAKIAVYGKKGNTLLEANYLNTSKDDNNRDKLFCKKYDSNISYFPETTNDWGAEGIKIAHDNSGPNPGWYVEYVELVLWNEDESRGYPYRINVNQWIASDEGWFKETNARDDTCIGLRCTRNSIEPFGGWLTSFNDRDSLFWNWDFYGRYDKPGEAAE